MPIESLLQTVQKWGLLFSAATSLVALIVSFTALIYTVRSFSRKEGAKIRATFLVQSTIESTQKHVCELTLENMKDRSIAVYTVFLKLGHNYYLELENFEDSPLVLEPFGTYSTQYDPVDFYSVSMTPIDLKELWTNRRQNVVLSTSDGKHVVKEKIRRWYPYADFFRNYSMAIIRPMRMQFRGKSYGSKVKFIVVIMDEGKEDEVIPLYPRDYQIAKFKNFRLTKEALESKENLHAFFEQMVLDNLLNYEDMEIWDMEAEREEGYKYYQKETFHAEHVSWFDHFVLGRLYTVADSLKTRYENKRRRRNR